MHIEKDLPPVPPPTEPATPSEEDDLDLLPERPSRIPSIRPVSYDAEATIRELEELAASIMLQDPVREVEQFAASLKGFGIPHIETDLWHEIEMPAAIAEESSPITPRPNQFQQIRPFQSQGRLAVPHIMVTNPSTESLLDQLNHDGVSLKSGNEENDDAEEMLWVNDYGAWGTSEKGKWKAVAEEVEEGEEEASGREQVSPSFSAPKVFSSRTLTACTPLTEGGDLPSSSAKSREGIHLRTHRASLPPSVSRLVTLTDVHCACIACAGRTGIPDRLLHFPRRSCGIGLS